MQSDRDNLISTLVAGGFSRQQAETLVGLLYVGFNARIIARLLGKVVSLDVIIRVTGVPAIGPP